MVKLWMGSVIVSLLHTFEFDTRMIQVFPSVDSMRFVSIRPQTNSKYFSLVTHLQV